MQPEVITTKALFEGVKALLRQQNRPDTPYGVAKFLGASRQSGYTWRDGGTMDAEFALKALKALGWDTEFGLACIAAESATKGHHNEAAAVWQNIARRLATAASICFLAVFTAVQMINPA